MSNAELAAYWHLQSHVVMHLTQVMTPRKCCWSGKKAPFHPLMALIACFRSPKKQHVPSLVLHMCSAVLLMSTLRTEPQTLSSAQKLRRTSAGRRDGLAPLLVLHIACRKHARYARFCCARRCYDVPIRIQFHLGAVQ